MNSRTPALVPALPHERVAAVCAATYYADLRDAYAFTFRVPATDTRFTVYASRADRYQVGDTYALILAAADAVPLPLGVVDVAFLRTCLHNAAHRWREAIAEADARAARPPQPIVGAPGSINVEPTPAGYRAPGICSATSLTALSSSTHCSASTCARRTPRRRGSRDEYRRAQPRRGHPRAWHPPRRRHQPRH